MVEHREEQVGIGAELGGLRRWWWLPIMCAVLAGGLANRMSAASDPVFRSSARFVIAPIERDSTSAVVDIAGVLDSATLATTLAEVLTSGKIENLASSSITLQDVDLSTLSIDAAALPDANVVALTVEGPSATATERAVAALGKAGAVHFQNLYAIYRVDELDVGFVEATQVAPSPVRDGAVGAFAGATFGIMFALALPKGRRSVAPSSPSDSDASIGLNPFVDRDAAATVGNGREPTSGSTIPR